jgi:hypothetical protein
VTLKKPFSRKLVATFTDTKPGTTTSYYTTLINWGDGSLLRKEISLWMAPGSFAVEGSHTYYRGTSFTVTVEIRAKDGRCPAVLSLFLASAQLPLSAPSRSDHRRTLP